MTGLYCQFKPLPFPLPSDTMNISRYVKLWLMVIFTSIYFLAQIAVSHVTHSLTLLVSSYQMLYNILSLLGYVVSIKMSRETTLRNTFGWARIEVLSLLCSILFLAALCFGAVVESFQTMVHMDHQDAMHHPIVVLAIGLFGIMLNLLCFVLLGGYTRAQGCFLHVQGDEVEVNVVLTDDARQKTSENHTIEEFYLSDFLRDVSVCVVVVICSCVVYFFEGDVALLADPLLSLLAVALLLGSNFRFVKQSSLILLQTVPDNMDVDSLKKRFITKFPAIKNMHDVHVWRLTRDKIIATAHIVCDAPDDFRKMTVNIDEFFRKEGISLVTIQPEFIHFLNGAEQTSCILGCRNSKSKCHAQQCCPSEGKETEDEPTQIVL
uniref:Cation efflux protein transmembrane domain-containing protein n=1 Tax=Strigamia maritima TaxID=126957 RepID=T1J125_STRMM